MADRTVHSPGGVLTAGGGSQSLHDHATSRGRAGTLRFCANAWRAVESGSRSGTLSRRILNQRLEQGPGVRQRDALQNDIPLFDGAEKT